VAVFFLSGLRLRSAGSEPLRRSAATPLAGLHGRGSLPPSTSPSCGGAAALGWGRSASSRTRSATFSPAALLLLLRLALLPVTVDFLEVKSTPNPLCFDSRVWSCPFFDTSHLDTAVASVRIQTHTYTTQTHTSPTPLVHNQTYNYTQIRRHVLDEITRDLKAL
jgi:hypothetical protein